MGRHVFYVDQKALQQELDALNTPELQERYDAAWETLFGEDALPEYLIQDDETMEEMVIKDRAIEQIAGKLLKERQATSDASITDAETPYPPNHNDLSM